MKYTSSDIKELKYEKRIGFAFSAIVLTFGALFNLIYLNQESRLSLLILIMTDSFIIGLGVLISYLMNRKINLDLKSGERIVKIGKIQKKERQIDYEPGSGALYIPILGDLVPKIWSQKMKEIKKVKLIIDGYRYDVDRELFERVIVGEEVEMYYAKYSEILLGIDKIEGRK